MESTSNPNSSEPAGGAQPEETANQPRSSETPHCALNPLCSAINEGAQRARAAAEKAIPKVKAGVLSATYWLGYGASFVTVFSYTLVKGLSPEVLKAGCREGAQAGQKKGEELVSKMKEQPGAPPPSSSDSSEGVTQPAGT